MMREVLDMTGGCAIVILVVMLIPTSGKKSKQEDSPPCAPVRPAIVHLTCESPRLDVHVYRPQMPYDQIGLWCVGADTTIDVSGNTSCVAIEQRPAH